MLCCVCLAGLVLSFRFAHAAMMFKEYASRLAGGTGKTHLAIALGVEATKQKRRVLFTRAADLVRQLLEARDTRELTRLQQRLLRVDVLIVDELGFVPFDRVGRELLFNLLTDRYERRGTRVANHPAVC